MEMMSMADSSLTGREGERIAAIALEGKGLVIVARNYAVHRMGEIDIIARDGEIVVFVEVKTRKNADFARAADFVGASKQQKIRNTALTWLIEQGESDRQARFDVVEVYYDRVAGGPARVNHIENAF